MQVAACNRLHRLRQRCCYWLLTAQDSVQEQTFMLTHEFLALMMGVNRSRLSTTLQNLQRDGFISYRYASVTVTNRSGLEDAACECYRTMQSEADEVCGLARA